MPQFPTRLGNNCSRFAGFGSPQDRSAGANCPIQPMYDRCHDGRLTNVVGPETLTQASSYNPSGRRAGCG